jgi:hypothetical protein
MVEELVADRCWAEIPYFRKPWFLALLFLVFMPGYLLVIWTGDTYYRKQGTVFRASRKHRSRMTYIVALLMLTALMRQFH